MTATEFPPLEATCPTCAGTGKVPKAGYTYIFGCPDCYRGKRLTPFGRAVLELVAGRTEVECDVSGIGVNLQVIDK